MLVHENSVDGMGEWIYTFGLPTLAIAVICCVLILWVHLLQLNIDSAFSEKPEQPIQEDGSSY